MLVKDYVLNYYFSALDWETAMINQEKMALIFEELKSDLGEGFGASEIWSHAEGSPLVKDHGYNNNPKVSPLFNEVTRKLYKTLKESSYPGLGSYYLVNLNNDHLVVVLMVGKYQLFILVDLTKTSMGVLMGVALPNLLGNLAEESQADGSAELDSPTGEEAEKMFGAGDIRATGWALYKQLREAEASPESDAVNEKFTFREALREFFGFQR